MKHTTLSILLLAGTALSAAPATAQSNPGNLTVNDGTIGAALVLAVCEGSICISQSVRDLI